MDKKRSKGVTILGSLNKLLFGFFGLITWSLGLLLTFNQEAAKDLYTITGSMITARIFMVYMIAISAALMVTGNGVLKLKENARQNTLYIGMVMLIVNVLINLKHIFTTAFLGSLFYPVLLIYFFTRPEVKQQFMEQNPE